MFTELISLAVIIWILSREHRNHLSPNISGISVNKACRITTSLHTISTSTSKDDGRRSQPATRFVVVVHLTDDVHSPLLFSSTAALYISEKGDDASGDGSEAKPLKTLIEAMRRAKAEPFPPFMTENNDEKIPDKWALVSASQIKKIKKIWQREAYKNDDKAKKEAEDDERRLKNLDESKNVIIELDTSLPAATQIKLGQATANRGKRVTTFGWIHRLRRQGKSLMFIVLRDGSGFLQCVLSDKLCQTYDALILQTEATVQVYGTLVESDKAPGGHELKADYWRLIGNAPPGGIENALNQESHIDVQLDQRHLMLRGETLSKIMQFRAILLRAFRDHYQSVEHTEITPPTLVQSQVEGGSTLFKFDYFGEEVSL